MMMMLMTIARARKTFILLNNPTNSSN
jgi:hypothetical protein